MYIVYNDIYVPVDIQFISILKFEATILLSDLFHTFSQFPIPGNDLFYFWKLIVFVFMIRNNLLVHAFLDSELLTVWYQYIVLLDDNSVSQIISTCIFCFCKSSLIPKLFMYLTK